MTSWTQRNQRTMGLSLIEVIITIGLLSMLVFGAMSLLSLYFHVTKKAIAQGQHEDLRQYIRSRLDCSETIGREISRCISASPRTIRGYDKNGNPLANTNGRLRLGKYELKLECQSAGDGIAGLPIEFTDTGEPLFDVPIECTTCVNDGATYYHLGASATTACNGSELAINGNFDAIIPPTGSGTTTGAQASQLIPTAGYAAAQRFSTGYGIDHRCLSSSVTGCSSSSTCYPVQGMIHVRDSPNQCHRGYYDHCQDQGRMLVINNRSTRTNFWCQKIPVNPSAPGTIHKFSVRVRTATPSPGYFSRHRWYIRGDPTFDIDTNPASSTGGWDTHIALWTSSGQNEIELCGRNIDTAATTGDLIVDNISFRECN